MTLRARLLLGMALVGVALVVTLFGAARATERYLIDQVDDQLRSADVSIGDVLLEGSATEDLETTYIGMVMGELGLVTMAGPDHGGPDIRLEDVEAHGTDPFTVGEGKDRWRAIAVDVDRFDVTLVLARPLDDAYATMGHLLQIALVGATAVLLVLSLVTWWVLRLGVRPINHMTETVTAIAAGDRTRRVDPSRPGTEVDRLGKAFNRMLVANDEAFARQAASEERLRMFVADASHELGTPIATIRGYTELHRLGGLREDAELTEAMRRTEQEAVRMHELVDDLMLLAQLDEDPQLDHELVDIGRLARDTATDARAIDPSRVVTCSTPESAEVIGDEGRLRQVVANLVRNALDHTPAGTPVDLTVTIDEVAHHVVLEVDDPGPGMAPEVAERAFDRLYRGDPARGRRARRGGSGLGLAIVKAAVEAHRGSVTLRSIVGEGTRVRVELPMARRPDDDADEPQGGPGEHGSVAPNEPGGDASDRAGTGGIGIGGMGDEDIVVELVSTTTGHDEQADGPRPGPPATDGRD